MECGDKAGGFGEEKDMGLQGLFIELLHRYTAMNYGQIMDVGVHPKQFLFLNMIRAQEGISQSDLATKLHVKPPTVAVTVKRLEKAEVVYRRTDPKDMRISRIYLTDKGKAIAGKIETIVEENERILTDGFSEEELAQFRYYMKRVIANLGQPERFGEIMKSFEDIGRREGLRRMDADRAGDKEAIW